MSNNLRPQFAGSATLFPTTDADGKITGLTGGVDIEYIDNESRSVVTLNRRLHLWETLTPEQKAAANMLMMALMQRVNTELL